MFAGLDVDETGLFAGTRGRQIAGRFTLIPARPFDYGTREQRQTWQGLVAAMETGPRLHDHKPGTLARLGEYLFGSAARRDRQPVPACARRGGTGH